MYGVNLDLLRTPPYHPDGGPNDPHAHHRAEHLTVLAEDRLERRRTFIRRIFGLLGRAQAGRKVVNTPCS